MTSAFPGVALRFHFYQTPATNRPKQMRLNGRCSFLRSSALSWSKTFLRSWVPIWQFFYIYLLRRRSHTMEDSKATVTMRAPKPAGQCTPEIKCRVTVVETKSWIQERKWLHQLLSKRHPEPAIYKHAADRSC